MNKQESKYFNTASFFDEALLKLLENKEYEYISVKEICEKAGVNRSTFYLHYESMDDLLKESLEYITKKLINSFDIDTTKFISDLNNKSLEELNFINAEYLKPYLEFTKENKNVLMAAYKNPSAMNTLEKYYNLEKYIIYPILEKYNVDPSKKNYYIQFYINGVISIIKEWVISNCVDDIDFIVDTIIECVKP